MHNFRFVIILAGPCFATNHLLADISLALSVEVVRCSIGSVLEH
jgi:hypothetical protein